MAAIAAYKLRLEAHAKREKERAERDAERQAERSERRRPRFDRDDAPAAVADVGPDLEIDEE